MSPAGVADFADRDDFEASDRGFIAALDPMVIKAADGRVVWDMDWGFLDDDCPDTVNPSLWRQARLTAKHGLYEVTDGIYQVRGFEMSNMTLVESDNGVIVIDPLISERWPPRRSPSTAPTGATGPSPRSSTPTPISITSAASSAWSTPTPQVPILAPEHFLEHAVSENVYAGTAMLRALDVLRRCRAREEPDRAPSASGSAPAARPAPPGSSRRPSTITHTGQEEVLDGVRIVFQMTPGTECPAEMNFYFPAHRALCMAENATHNLHNLLTLRGAQVRDPRIWSRYLDEVIDLFARDADVSFASHHWPTWGTDAIVTYLPASATSTPTSTIRRCA